MKVCKRCKIQKALSEFTPMKDGKDGVCTECKPCRQASAKERVERNKERMREVWRDLHAKHAAKRNAYGKRYYANNVVRMRAKSLRNHHDKKHQVFMAYGGYICKCCGETEPMFLSIDHVNNDGAAHRRTLRTGTIYRWIVSNGFPPGFQVLCHNCNQGKRLNGGTCPHQSKAQYGFAITEVKKR